MGLLTYPEAYLLDNNNIRKTGQTYWIGSPYTFSYNYVSGHWSNSTGSLNIRNISTTGGVRPAISLKPGTVYTSGNGSKNSPYIVE